MTGVTIGVGHVHLPLAALAADCVRQMCGIEVIILTDKEFKESGLRHPAALKLKIFDLVKDDQLFYFDADWFCVNQWPLNRVEIDGSLLACRDFVLVDDWPNQYWDTHSGNVSGMDFCYNTDLDFRNERWDYIQDIQNFAPLTLLYYDWINTGLFIANRAKHNELFKIALNNYLTFPGNHPKYYEQPAINLAIQECGTKVGYLDRKKNILVASRGQWPNTITGLHVKLKRHPEFIRQVQEKKIVNAEHIRKYFIFRV